MEDSGGIIFWGNIDIDHSKYLKGILLEEQSMLSSKKPRWRPSLLSLESFHFLFLVVRHNLDMENTKRSIREVRTTTL